MRQVVTALVCCALLLGAAAPAGADEYEDHVSRAMAMARGEQHREALREWEAAYALRQAPRLLYEIARSQQSLGMTDEAIVSYERYLAADRGEDPRSRAESEAHLARLRRLREPVAPAAASLDPGLRYVPVHYEMRANRPLLTAGITLLSIGYGASFVSGVTMASIFGASGSSSSDRHLTTASGLLVIPVIGPLISAIYLPASGERDAGLYWTMPWMLTAVPLQAAGLIMTVIGAKQRHRVPVMPLFSERLQITPYSTLGGGGLVATGRF